MPPPKPKPVRNCKIPMPENATEKERKQVYNERYQCKVRKAIKAYRKQNS